MKRRFLIHLALLLIAAMLLSTPVMAEDLTSVTAVEPAEEIYNLEEAPQPEELPEFQLGDPGSDDTNNTDVAVEAAEMTAPADNDIPKAAAPTKLTLGVKETYALKITGVKKYETSDKTVATVTKKGIITAKKTGKATITATDKNGKKTKVKLTVKKAPDTVTLSKTKATLKVGKTLQLKAKLPTGTASNKMTWTSSNKKVATVSAAGKVTAVKAGDTKITITTANGKKATCAIRVKSIEIKDFILKKIKTINASISDKLLLESEGYFNGYFDASVDRNNLITQLNLYDETGKYALYNVFPGMKKSKALATLNSQGWNVEQDSDGIIYLNSTHGSRYHLIVFIDEDNSTVEIISLDYSDESETSPVQLTVDPTIITVYTGETESVNVFWNSNESLYLNIVTGDDCIDAEWGEWIDTDTCLLNVTGLSNGLGKIEINDETGEYTATLLFTVQTRAKEPDHTPGEVSGYLGRSIYTVNDALGNSLVYMKGNYMNGKGIAFTTDSNYNVNKISLLDNNTGGYKIYGVYPGMTFSTANAMLQEYGWLLITSTYVSSGEYGYMYTIPSKGIRLYAYAESASQYSTLSSIMMTTGD